ncbi:MAG TPA: ABC transporter permease [Gemmatimonadaceae bacterium]|nr:ABC transporter permease [Gemmatimonadaceae bacterium]
MRELLNRLRDWLRRDRLDAELNEELRFHHARLEGDARAAGASVDEARHAAHRRLGSPTRAREEARDRWSLPWLEHVFQDIRYALRGLRKSPGFTATVLVTLALGIGANAAMFGIIDRLMFRPFPYLRDPARVHRVYFQTTERGRDVTMGSGEEYARYLDIKNGTSSFSQYAGFSTRPLAVGTGDAARERQVAVVSATFFDFFDARPALGRFFTAAEDSTPRGADVAVVSYEYWQRELGGRSDILGTTLQVNNVTSVIIGVAPRGFVGINDDRPPDVFFPITTYAGAQPDVETATTYFTRYNWGWMAVLVRRKPGVSIETASADLSNAHLRSWNAERALEPRVPSAAIAHPRAVAGPIKQAAGPNPGLDARTVRWVTGVALIVLLIACANVANLFLARALRRRRETAVRLALGVSRGRLIAQCLTESILLALMGCVAAVGLAQWGGTALERLFVPDGAPLHLLTDWRTIGVASALALLGGVVTGLAPAILSARSDLAASLKAGAREGTYHRSRVRAALLVVQGALSVLLLVGAGLFVRSLEQVRAMRLGYDVEHVLLAERNLRSMKMSDSGQVALGKRLLETAQAIPGVEHAAWVSSIPFWSTSSTDLFVAGIDSVRRLGRFTYQTATPDYFQTMGTRIVRGRAYTEADRAGTPLVAVVSEAMARALWPGKEAIGQCMRIRQASGKLNPDTLPCTTVVGIAEDAAQNSLIDDLRLRYYLPSDQFRPVNGFALILRMRSDPALIAESVRKALQREMPGQTYVTVRPMRELVDQERRSWRLGATMFVAFGVLALLVAAVGLYGVIAYNVAQRMQELGVRIALGAQSGDVVRLVVLQALRFGLAGVAVGGALALAAGRWIQPLLFHEKANDPVVFGGVTALLLLVALAASAAPALRASRADPNLALRGD